MINEVKMWSAQCDGCKETYLLYGDYTAMNEKSAIEDSLKIDDEWVLLDNEKVFCPDCHKIVWDEEDDKKLAFSKDTDNSSSQLLGEVV